MAKRVVEFKVVTVIDYPDELNWKASVRSIRNTLKEVINSKPGMRIKSIENREVKE